MVSWTEFKAGNLKKGWHDGSGNLKSGCTTSSYTGGDPSSAADIKSSIVNSAGKIRSGMCTDGDLCASMKPADSASGGEIVTENLALHLDAGDSDSYGGSGTVWSDLTETGADFDLVNGPVFDGTDGGGSFAFDGTNDLTHAQTTNEIYNTANGTLEMWIKFDSLTGSEIVVATLGGAGYSGGGTGMGLWMVSYTDTKMRLWGEVAGGSPDIHTTHPDGTGSFTPTVTWSTDVWYHIVYVHADDGEGYLYRDGVLVGQETDGQTGAIEGTQAKKQRFMAHFYGTKCVPGSLAVARIYKGSALSAAEVEQNYDAQKSRFGH